MGVDGPFGVICYLCCLMLNLLGGPQPTGRASGRPTGRRTGRMSTWSFGIRRLQGHCNLQVRSVYDITLHTY